MSKVIKAVKMIQLTDIDIPHDTLTRQSLVKLLKGNPAKWLSNIKKKNSTEYENMKELMASMKAKGQIECIGVEQIDVPSTLLKEDGREGIYFLIYGLRRFLAAYFLGWKKIKAVVR